MISSEAQRKLVKSPPELWAELSDPASLGRHLGELGEIRITNTEPERSVEWEAEAARGKVELKPSGWGTQVTLTIARELPRTPDDASESEPTQPAEPAEPEPTAEREPKPTAEREPEHEATAEATPGTIVELAPETPAEGPPQEEATEQAPEKPAPRRSFFARLFRRRSRAETPSAVEMSATSETPTPAETPATIETPTTVEAPMPAEAPLTVETPTTVEAPKAEEAFAAQTTELLNGVLDRLGAAHHRPFSRA